jgi:hypothetical protein
MSGDVLVLHVDHLLQLVDVHLLDVLLARGPRAVLQCDDAPNDLGEALQEDQRSREGDERLERIDGRPVDRDGRVLADEPGLLRVVPARPDHGDRPRHEEGEVEDEVDRRLEAHGEEAVEHVAPHVAALREGVGAGHHEEDAVAHDLHVERPGVRGVEELPREHLPGDEPRERDDEPGEELAEPGGEPVDPEEEALHGGS